MKKIQIHGKDYVMVKDRIIFFNEHYPKGSIVTELKATDNSFIFKATVIPEIENSNRKFTGHAEEVIGSSQINKTSALENAETSAIGRALACMGIGVEDAFASANEVQNAIHQQEKSYYKKTDNQLGSFDNLLNHPYFEGKKADTKKAWKNANTFSDTELILTQMQQRITQYEKELELDEN